MEQCIPGRNRILRTKYTTTGIDDTINIHLVKSTFCRALQRTQYFSICSLVYVLKSAVLLAARDSIAFNHSGIPCLKLHQNIKNALDFNVRIYELKLLFCHTLNDTTLNPNILQVIL